MTPEPITVGFPTGIGDCHWSCMKLKALKELHGGAPIHALVNEGVDHKSVGYLEMIPHIDKAIVSDRAPLRITTEMPPCYKDDKWATLEGSRDWNGLDYIFVANGHLEQGRHIRDWMPELETEYEFEYVIRDRDVERSMGIMPEPRVLIYLSAYGPNWGFHGNWWDIGKWQEVIRLLNETGIVPMIVGAATNGDQNYARGLESGRRGIEFDNIVGQTSIPVIVHMLQRCWVWTGLNSGLGIVSASMGTPTVMLWADDRWPVGKVNFCHDMKRSWLSDRHLHRYHTLSFGDERTTPETVLNALESGMMCQRLERQDIK